MPALNIWDVILPNVNGDLLTKTCDSTSYRDSTLLRDHLFAWVHSDRFHWGDTVQNNQNQLLPR
jgi:hypothetical protein